MLTRIAAVLIAAHAFLCSPAAAQSAPSFTYQGTFTDNGAPANGLYDISVQVYDADTLGTLLGSALVLDYDVENGLFSIDVAAAPGGVPLFDGSDRWIQVGFRDADASIFDSFIYTGRTLVKHAPQAAYALTAGALADPIWAKDSFFDSAYWGDGDSRVGINTIFAFPDATLAVHRETDGEHGILVSTSGINGSPFLDLNAGSGAPGTTRVKMQYEGQIGAFTMSHTSGDLLTVTPGVGVEVINGSVAADDFTYSAPETRVMSISAAAWRPQKSLFYILQDLSQDNMSYIAQSVSQPENLLAPLAMPEGGKLESIEFHFRCLGAAQIEVAILFTANDGMTSGRLGYVTLDSTTPSPYILVPPPDFRFLNPVLNYTLAVRSSDWTGGAVTPVGISGTVIRYSVEEPD